MKIVIKRARGLRQRWRFVIVADNGEVVAQSETYARRVDALDTAESIRGSTIDIIAV